VSCVDRASEVYVLRLAILAILLTTIIIAAPLAAEHGLEAVVYPDGKDDSVMLRSLKYLGIWCFSFSNLSSWAARS